MKAKHILTAIVLAAGCLLITGCSQNRPLARVGEAEPGNFIVSLTDSPGDYSALNIEIVKVEAYLENRGWVVLNDRPQHINVLNLTNGGEVKLAQSKSIGNGFYSKIRISFGEENYVRFKPGAYMAGIILNEKGETRLALGEPRQVEIDINRDVNERTGAAVLLDFNVAQSINQEDGRCIMNPVITEIEDVTTGIRGFVENSPGAAIILSDGVYSYSTYVNNQGHFLLRGVDAGTYDMVIIPAGETILGGHEHMVEGLVVNSGQITQVGSIRLL